MLQLQPLGVHVVCHRRPAPLPACHLLCSSAVQGRYCNMYCQTMQLLLGQHVPGGATHPSLPPCLPLHPTLRPHLSLPSPNPPVFTPPPAFHHPPPPSSPPVWRP
jgi:hypothetical protein